MPILIGRKNETFMFQKMYEMRMDQKVKVKVKVKVKLSREKI
jgi:hypothetical protein